MATPHHRNLANSAPPSRPMRLHVPLSGENETGPSECVWERAGVAMWRRRELDRCRCRRRRHRRRRRDNLIGRRLQSSLMTRSARRGYCVVVRPFCSRPAHLPCSYKYQTFARSGAIWKNFLLNLSNCRLLNFYIKDVDWCSFFHIDEKWIEG